MKLFIIIIIIILTLPNQKIAKESFLQLVIWDVGQGQWVTLVTPRRCLHIDIGGEFITWKAVLKLCHNKINRIYLTHYDWDHIRFARQLKYHIPATCLQLPIHYRLSLKKQRFLSHLPLCFEQDPKFKLLIHKIFSGSSQSSNHQSRVFTVLNRILISGDSVKSQEKIWRSKAPPSIDTLILGHHGSRTSTSKELLNSLALKQTIVSSRKKKYGHPHSLVTRRLKQHRVPLLKTEDWGNIHLLLTK